MLNRGLPRLGISVNSYQDAQSGFKTPVGHFDINLLNRGLKPRLGILIRKYNVIC